MSRPKEHGGGQAGPPIAGDPSSFPIDAELSRTLVAANRMATLSTLTAAGYPYGSVVSYAADDVGQPIVLISEMAEHTPSEQIIHLTAAFDREGKEILLGLRVIDCSDTRVIACENSQEHPFCI